MILEVSWDGLWTLSFGLSQFHGHGSWLVCEVVVIPKIFSDEHPTQNQHPKVLYYKYILILGLSTILTCRSIFEYMILLV
jgi:hypothetical protein